MGAAKAESILSLVELLIRNLESNGGVVGKTSPPIYVMRRNSAAGTAMC